MQPSALKCLKVVIEILFKSKSSVTHQCRETNRCKSSLLAKETAVYNSPHVQLHVLQRRQSASST